MMQLKIEGDVTIMAPATKVWRVVGHEFAQIDVWASAIPRSTAVSHFTLIKEANLAGRVCASTVPGFSDVQEEFTDYDEAHMRFSYQATQSLPSFVQRAINNWSVHPTGKNQCRVEMRGEVTVPLLRGIIMAPLMKWQFRRLGAITAEELKYYLEHDQPHPRKIKAQRKQVGATAI